MMINRLLTTYKLKNYIVNKLTEFKLDPNISLAEYYEISPRELYLNFTVINVNE